MTLSALIRKGGLAKLATATPATFATDSSGEAGSVAGVATVAVASLAEAQTVGAKRIPASAMTAEADILAGEVPRPAAAEDDRRHCAQCANIAKSGLCLAARRGEIAASRDYHLHPRRLKELCQLLKAATMRPCASTPCGTASRSNTPNAARHHARSSYTGDNSCACCTMVNPTTGNTWHGIESNRFVQSR